MTREFEDLGGGIDVPTEFGGGIKVDVVEDDEAVTVTADLPGFDSEDIDVNVQDNVLTIDAEHAVETEEESDESEAETYHRRERRRRSVSRRVRIPTAVETDEAAAEYQNGVLTVTLPTVDPEAAGGHSIDVE